MKANLTVSRLQQNWKIQEDFLEAVNGEITICQCSYPYFNWVRISNNNEYWQPVTCLIQDNCRDISYCPNCDRQLVEEQQEDEGYNDFTDSVCRPLACVGCFNYHGQEYGGNLLICAMHPQGWDNENCPDFSPNADEMPKL